MRLSSTIIHVAISLIYLEKLVSLSETTSYTTTIGRELDKSDTLIVKECTNNGNCTQICERTCKEQETAYFDGNGSVSCLDNLRIIEEREECLLHFSLSISHLQLPISHFKLSTLVPRRKSLYPIQALYQTRKKLWFQYNVVTCSIRSKCIYIQTPNGGKCLNLAKCFQFVKVPGTGAAARMTRLNFTCGKDDERKLLGQVNKLSLNCIYQDGSEDKRIESCMLFKIPGTVNFDGKMSGICPEPSNKNSSCVNNTMRNNTSNHEERDESVATLPFLVGIILFLGVVVTVSLLVLWKRRKSRYKLRRHTLSMSSIRSSTRSSVKSRTQSGTLNNNTLSGYEIMNGATTYVRNESTPVSPFVPEDIYLEPVRSNRTKSTASSNGYECPFTGSDKPPRESEEVSEYEMLYPPRYESPQLPQGYEIMKGSDDM